MDNHREHVESLADHMRQLNNDKWGVFTEKFLGPRWQTSAGEGLIPDVLAIRKSYTKPCVRILEVKVTESDFQRSLKEGKWSRYLPFCNQFYFAAPSGVIAKSDLPERGRVDGAHRQGMEHGT